MAKKNAQAGTNTEATPAKTVAERVRELVKANKTHKEIAETLKAEGFKSTRGKPLSVSSVAYHAQGGKKNPAKRTTPRKQKSANLSSIAQAVALIVAPLSKETRTELGLQLIRDAK